MKRIITSAAALFAALSLTACSGNGPDAALKKTDSALEVYACGMKIPFPSDWEVLTGDDVYEKLYENSTGYKDVKELKENYTGNGAAYLMYAASPDSTTIFSLTSLKITPDGNSGERLDLEEYSRTNHNDSLIGWQMDGYSLRNTGFGMTEMGGNSAWESRCEVYTEDSLLMGQTEYTFEYGECFCSLQSYYHTPEAGESASAVIGSISAQ